MASKSEDRQRAMWENRDAEAGPKQAPSEASGEPRLQAVNRHQMAWRAVDVEHADPRGSPGTRDLAVGGEIEFERFL